MVLSLKHQSAVIQMAEVLYDFLPGPGAPKWRGHVSFKTVAEKAGVGDFWQPGSKKPMIISLLGKTLEFRRGQFEPLLLEIVNAGLVYRQSHGNPVRQEDIDSLKGLILEVGFKFPNLWDPEVKASLEADGKSRARENLERELSREKLRVDELNKRSGQIHSLREQFFALHGDDDRQRVGLEFEKILNSLFALHQLSSRGSFRVAGEQIDGSFVLDGEVYLVEAKWTRKQCPEADLLVFHGKIDGKSKYTRGVFVSINGITPVAEDSITRGKQPNFFVINGYDIAMLLEDDRDLADFLRQRQRLLAEQGRICVPFDELHL